MAIRKNVAKGEARIILGAILVIWGLSLSGFWKPISIVVGGFFVITAFVGY